MTGIKEIVDHALAWELRSGATFEGEKTVLGCTERKGILKLI